MTDSMPARELYGGLPNAIARHGLLDASYLVGYAWADEPRVGASAVAVGRDARSARLAARELAAEWWKRRAEFSFGVTTGTVDECIGMARQEAARARPVFISDAGDNITGGGVGDVPSVLQRMLEAGLSSAVYAGLFDPDAVAACRSAGLGAKLLLGLGGRFDAAHGHPLPVRGTVVRLAGGQAVIDVEGVKVVLTERRTAFTTLRQFLDLGIDPRECTIVAVKLGYLFPELRAIARAAFLAMSPGVINPDLTALPYRRLSRPMYPLDSNFEYEEESP
jgi:microcystin degradation protein MlrC